MSQQNSGTTPPGVVLVPVPEEHLPAVYALLGNLMQQRSGGSYEADEVTCLHCGASAYLAAGGAYHCSECGLVFRQPGPPGSIEVDHENGCWTRMMVQRLYDEVGPSVAGRALTLVATRAPSTVSSTELTGELKVDQPTLRAELGALSKASKRLFQRKVWPMSARQGWGEGAKMGYRMPEQVASWWLEADRAARPALAEAKT